MLDLALAFDDEKAFLATERGLLLKGHDVLDTGILNAGNDIFFHIRCKVTKKMCNFARRIKKLASYDIIKEVPA